MWDEYCSWYIEMTKPQLTLPQPSSSQGAGADHGDRATAQQVLVFVLDRLLRMLHPIVPFVTEAIWAELNKVAPMRGLRKLEHAESLLITAAWPKPDPALGTASPRPTCKISTPSSQSPRHPQRCKRFPWPL
jgi:valyl-tRNA synthetase